MWSYFHSIYLLFIYKLFILLYIKSFGSNGLKNERIEIRDGPIGLGFFAIEDIAEDELLIEVSRLDQITIEDLVQTLEQEIGKEKLENWESKMDCLERFSSGHHSSLIESDIEHFSENQF